MAVAGQEVRWVRTKLRLATKPPSVLTFTPQQQQQQQWRTRVPRSDWLARVVVFFLRAPTASFSSTGESVIFMRLPWRPL